MANDSEKFVNAPQKRPGNNIEQAAESAVSDAKRSKRNEANMIDQNKNPVSVLNQLRTGLKYDLVDQSGPSHAPIFKVAVEVDGQSYCGSGGSKKMAKCKAAEEALKSFIQFPDNTNTMFLAPTNTTATNVDFTSDDAFEALQKKKEARAKKQVLKGPVMLLNELFRNVAYECTDNKGCSYSRFKVTITLADEKFSGTGSSKKLAKNAAATAALSKLRLNFKNLSSASVHSFMKPDVLVEDQERSDYIGGLVQDKFAALMTNDATHAKRKVLAGIVMTRGTDLCDSEVISVTTGTKCVSGEHISMNGCSLNDMHAEIISRRCLMNYLYDQLDLLLTPEADRSVFTKREDGNGYRLKEGIDFHLYINTAPCGDARIFSPHEEYDAVDKHPNRSSRGQLRTKIESGEGTLPVKLSSTIQTWDGILQGERLLTMSCSDKICRWNIVGLQGALLSHFIEPIYLKSIVLGSLLRESHLFRAIYGRIENALQGLPPPFRLNRPSMYLLTSSETRQPGKAPNFSVIWMKGLEKPEIINTYIGKPEVGISKVCKHELMKRFTKLMGKLSTITEIEKEPPSLYCDAKDAVASYNVAKQYLNTAFTKSGLGSWVSKPLEQDTFEMTAVERLIQCDD